MLQTLAATARDKSKSPERSLRSLLQTEVGLNPAQSAIALELFVDHLQNYFSELREPGTIIHTAVDQTEPPGKPIKHCKVVPIKLTLFHNSDVDVQLQKGTVDLRAIRILRLCNEARSQGGLLSYEDLSHLLGIDMSTVKKLVKRLRAKGILVPSRGAVKDIGPEPSHKRNIANLLGRGYSTSQVAAITAHSEGAIGRYQLQFSSVLFLLHTYPQATDDQFCQLSELPMKTLEVYRQVAKELAEQDDCKPHLERLRRRYELDPDALKAQIPEGKRPQDIARKRLEAQNLATAFRQTIQEDLDTTKRVAETVSDDLIELLKNAYRLPQELRPGEFTLFVDALMTSYVSGKPSEDRKVIPVAVPMYTQELLDIWRGDESLDRKRARIAVRIATTVQEQGGVMTVAGLAELLHISPSAMAKSLREFATYTHVTVPTKGLLEDAGSTLTHKDWIVDLDQHGLTGQEISWLTRHAPISRDRYIQAYRRAEIVMNLEDALPTPEHLAKLLRLRKDVAQQYVELLKRYHPQMAARSTSSENTALPPESPSVAPGTYEN